MERMKLIKGCILIILAYFFVMSVTYFAAGDQFHYRYRTTDMISASTTPGELLTGDVLEQRFSTGEDTLLSLGIQFTTFSRSNAGSIKITLVDGITELYSTVLDSADLQDYAVKNFVFPKPIENMSGKVLSIKIESLDGIAGTAVSVNLGNYVAIGRVDIPKEIRNEDKAILNGVPTDAQLCFNVKTRTDLLFGQYYWHITLIIGFLLTAYCCVVVYKHKHGLKCTALMLVAVYKRYKFLLHQLVSRDFKRKYKRSVLGVFWSFLNPLLTMLVQYVIFSTLFSSSIPNFALYLLIGIICFSFFNEVASTSLSAIVGNASLIKKVYMPKYIYPISKACSACINLMLSMILLILVLLITQTPITFAWALLPFGLVCLIAFGTGMGLFLSSAMVFFRDTQFLWGVISLLWMYLTPIFYPETIIPDEFLPLYRLNPMYQIIRFIREILMNGISPEPKAYLFCILASFIPLLIGVLVFKKTQDKFILHM